MIERLIGLAIASLLLMGMQKALAQPLTAQQVYDAVAPSVWRVTAYDGDNLPLSQGSAVVIAPQTLVTNCHVLSKAHRLSVRHGGARHPARLELWDVQRDLCQLHVDGLQAPAVTLGDSAQVATGQPVYALGNPRGMDLTMSAGLLSSIRRNDAGQVLLLQTSAPISGGSSGGGLFDDRATLIGLTTIGSAAGDVQNLNFAIPAEWIADLPRRHGAALGK